ncbi:hypothetical protein J6590_099859, partial [Homalodisca vitripennis]
MSLRNRERKSNGRDSTCCPQSGVELAALRHSFHTAIVSSYTRKFLELLETC